MISVTVPIYKKKIDLINRCFNSILSQTYKDIEVIVVYDDFNDEENKTFVETFCKNNNWKFIYSPVPKSLYMARIIGMKNMIGDYFFVIDADDTIDNDYLQELITNIQDYDIIVGHEKYYEIKGKVCLHQYKDEINVILEKAFPYLRGLIFKDIILQYLKLNEEYFLPRNEDYLTKFFIYSLTKKIIIYKGNSYYNYFPQLDSGVIAYFRDFKYLFSRYYSMRFIFQKVKQQFIQYINSVTDWFNQEYLILSDKKISSTYKLSSFEKQQFQKLLSQNFDYNQIPKYIHYIWIGDKIEPPQVQTFDKNKDYVIIKWDGKELINHPWVKSCLQYKKYDLASDYIRLFYLYNYGGWYFDTDNKCIKDLSDNFKDNDFIIGWENNDLILGFNVIACKKSDYRIKKLMNWYDEHIYSEELNKPFELERMDGKKYWIGGKFTINKIGTRIFWPMIKNGEIKPYPNEYFIAGHYESLTVDYIQTEKTYIKHIYKKSIFNLSDFGFQS